VRIGASVKEDRGVASPLFGCSDGGELEGKVQRKKKMWGKERELPPLLYLYRGTAVVERYHGAHDPDRFCKRRHVVACHGAAIPVTVPLSQLWQ
jgi:hypothetical protein